eukprot:4692552-Pyramimonas_sp.AAC.1
MDEEVDPAGAAPAGCASDDSISADVTCKTDAPIDPRCVVAEAMGLSLGRRIAYRAEGAGWIKTSIEQTLSSTRYLLAGEQKTTIENLAFRTPGGGNLNLDWGPVRRGPWAPAGATAKAALKPKPETPIDISPSSDSS